MQQSILKAAKDALDNGSIPTVAREQPEIRELELKVHQYSVALDRAGARAEVLVEGRLQGKQIMLLRQLSKKFGDPPAAIHTRIAKGTDVDVNLWADRVLFAETLEAVFSSAD